MEATSTAKLRLIIGQKFGIGKSDERSDCPSTNKKTNHWRKHTMSASDQSVVHLRVMQHQKRGPYASCRKVGRDANRRPTIKR